MHSLRPSSPVSFPMKTKTYDLEEEIWIAKRIVDRLVRELYEQTIRCYIVYQPQSADEPELIGVSNKVEVFSKIRPDLSFAFEFENDKVIIFKEVCSGGRARLNIMMEGDGSFKVFMTKAEAEREIAENQEKFVQKVNKMLDEKQSDGGE